MHAILSRPVSWPVGQLLTRHTRRLAVSRHAGRRSARSRRRGLPLEHPPRNRRRPARRQSRRAARRRAARVGPLRAAQLQPLTRRATPPPISSPASRRPSWFASTRSRRTVEPWLAESWTTADDGRRVHAEAAAATSPSPTATRSPPTMCCLRSRRCTTRRPAARSPTRCRPAARSSQVTATDPHTVVDHLSGAVRAGHAHARQPADSAAAQARSARSRPARSARPGASTRRRRRWSASARSSSASTCPGQRLVFARNPRYFAQGAGRRGAAVSRSAGRRDHPGPERRAAAARVGTARHDDQRDRARGLRAAEARRRRRDASSCSTSASSRNADGLWFNLKPGAFGRRPARGVAAARRAAPRDLDGGRSQAVRRHGVSRRRRAGLRPDHAGQQEVVLARPAADAARSGRARSSCSRRSA